MELAKAIRKAKRTYIIGNGGSYANAGHVANDLLAVGIKAYTLDAATLTASANDFGYETVFARWLAVVAEPGDLLIALSGSGTSPNIVAGIFEAERIGMSVERLFGDRPLNMQVAEEKQIILIHGAMLWLKVNP